MTRASIVHVALAAAASAALLAAWSSFGEETHATRQYLVVLAIIGGTGCAVFGWAVPRALRTPAAGWTAVVLGTLAVVTVVAFWSGLPPILAAGAAALGWAQRQSRRGQLALALGALAMIADLVVYLGDRTSAF